jgi:hemoglobin
MSREAEAGARTVQPGRHVHEHALAARTRKQDEARSIGVDEAYISAFVDQFYASIREDELLGPIFGQRVRDWPAHLDRMKAFWRSVLHNSGEFAGNPMLKHMVIPGLDDTHFSRWLNLFYATLRSLEPSPEATQHVGARARMIADSLLTGIETRRSGLAGARGGRELPHV